MFLFSGLMVSLYMGMSTFSLISLWAALELNMLIFLGMLGLMKDNSSDVSLKYFIVQSVGSVLFLVLLVIMMGQVSGLKVSLGVELAALVKMGAGPFHSWLVSVMSKMDWALLVVLASAQKVLPLVLLSGFLGPLAAVAVLTSAFVGVLGSVGQLMIKKLMAYSSVFNLAWMVGAQLSLQEVLQYLTGYIMGLAVVSSIVSLSGACSWSELLSGLSPGALLATIMGLLSMAGIPPLLGFFVKVDMVLAFVLSGYYLQPILLVVLSVFLVYMYMLMILSNLFSEAMAPLVWCSHHSVMMTWVVLLGGALFNILQMSVGH